jgi:toxin ParE1/3/4
MAEGARTYHISLSRNRAVAARVKQPRHFLLYRCREDGVIEVARVVHDGRDLARHLPEGYRRIDRGS